MMDIIKRRLAAPVFEDEDKTWAAWLFNLITLSLIGLLGIFIIARVFLGETKILMDVTNITIPGLILVMMGLQLVMRRGYVKVASTTLIGVSWLTLVYMAWNSRGINDTSLTALVVTILLANLLISWQNGVGVGIISILVVWAIAYAQIIEAITPEIPSPSPLQDALDLTVVFAVSTLVITLTTIHLKNVAIRARQSEQSLAESSHDLQSLNISLEQQVKDRTRRLEVVAQLSGHLSTILHVEELLTELVNRVKETFGYYHVQVYLLDQTHQKLTLAAGVGQVGAEMKAAGHHILFSTPASPVARAARTGQVVWLDNVHQSTDWLPDPLLPDTRTEIAVPIMLDQQAVGVLDVQENKIAGLTESDTNLLRSLANQVAIAIQNARNFEQVEAALLEVQGAQEQYITQAWQRAKTSAAVEPYLYTQPGATPLGKEEHKDLLAKQQLALTQSSPVIIEPAPGTSRHTLVAPINLRQKNIGTLQLQASSQSVPWTEDDLTVIGTIIDQVAQTAENLRLFDETRQQARQEQTLREVSEKMQAAANLEDLVKIAAQELSQRFSSDYALVEFGIDDISETQPAVVERNGH